MTHNHGGRTLWLPANGTMRTFGALSQVETANGRRSPGLRSVGVYQ